MFEDDLYDEMIVPTNEKSDTENERTSAKKNSETYSVYIGNFTWWTTEQDLLDLVAGAGVTDLVDIRIHDNPANGLSKGYATVTVESTVSIDLMMGKLRNKVMHNRRISVDELHATNKQRYENAFKELTLRTSTKTDSVDLSGQGLVPGTIAAVPTFASIALPVVRPVVITPVINIPPPPLYMQGVVRSIIANPPPPLRYATVAMNGQSTYAPPLVQPARPIAGQTSVHKKEMLSKEEFEEIFKLNRTVVERSMERAAQDAAGGLFKEAIETLVTAISLIKESKLGEDPQGLALVKPLQGLLQEIEKDYLSSKQKNIDERTSCSGGYLEAEEEHPEDFQAARNGHCSPYLRDVSPTYCDRLRDRRSPRHERSRSPHFRREESRSSHNRSVSSHNRRSRSPRNVRWEKLRSSRDRRERSRSLHDRRPNALSSSHCRSPVWRDRHRNERFSDPHRHRLRDLDYELEIIDDRLERLDGRLGRNRRR